MSTLNSLEVGKITFSNSSSEALPATLLASQSLILTVEGDNVNAWYDSASGNVCTSAKFTGTVHYRIGT
ncbi:MAG TPA: hypothetical protein DF712_17590 [Balneola sp.]|nr:hypothetical protein [Balneola sp.]